MSQCSPSSVGVESVSSGSWPWKRMWRVRCRNFSAARLTPGKTGSAASAFAFAGSLGPLLRPVRAHHHDRAARDAAVPLLERADVGDLERVLRVLRDLRHDRDHDERPHARRSRAARRCPGTPAPSAPAGRAACRTGRSTAGTPSPRSRPSRTCTALPVCGLTVALNFPGPKPFQTGMPGVISCVRSM